jgi:hypothetical protein
MKKVLVSQEKTEVSMFKTSVWNISMKINVSLHRKGLKCHFPNIWIILVENWYIIFFFFFVFSICQLYNEEDFIAIFS